MQHVDAEDFVDLNGDQEGVQPSIDPQSEIDASESRDNPTDDSDTSSTDGRDTPPPEIQEPTPSQPPQQCSLFPAAQMTQPMIEDSCEARRKAGASLIAERSLLAYIELKARLV